MSPELDRTLCNRYPAIFAERHAPATQSAMGWGFMLDDGWYALLDLLCAALQRETNLRAAPQVVATQVKEKFGSLHFRVHAASDRQRVMIALAERASTRICEVCGKPGAWGHYPAIGPATRCVLHRSG